MTGPEHVLMLRSDALLFAAAGALLSAMSKGFGQRSLWAAPSSGSSRGGVHWRLKAIVLWFPKDRVPAMNVGWSCSALWGLSAYSPPRCCSIGARLARLFAILAAVTVASALTIWVVVPEATSANRHR